MVVDFFVGKLCVVVVIDGLNFDDEVVIVYVKNFGSKCLYMVDFGVKVWDNVINGEILFLVLVYVVGLFC